MHLPSRYRHCLPGGCSSSLVGGPSVARSSRSLIPVGRIVVPSAPPAAEGRSEGVAAADASTGAAELPVRMLAAWAGAGCFGGVLFRTCEGGGGGLVRRVRSSRAERTTSHPDKSSNPTPTVCFIRLAILILLPEKSKAHSNYLIIATMWRVCGIMPPRNQKRHRNRSGCIYEGQLDNSSQAPATIFSGPSSDSDVAPAQRQRKRQQATLRSITDWPLNAQ